MGDRRAASGKFGPGQSGNPGGRPREVGDVRALARRHTGTALAALVRVLESPDSPSAAVVAAATALLDRGYGRPGQALEISRAAQVTPADVAPDLIKLRDKVLRDLEAQRVAEVQAPAPTVSSVKRSH